MSMCWFWTEVSPSTCIRFMANKFWRISWYKLSPSTKHNINYFNVTNLNWFVIETWISSPPGYHELNIVRICTVICIVNLIVFPSSYPITLFYSFSFKMLHVKIFTTSRKLTHTNPPHAPYIFAQCASRAQHNPHPRWLDGTVPTGTKPYRKYGVKTRPFGEDHGELSI